MMTDSNRQHRIYPRLPDIDSKINTMKNYIIYSAFLACFLMAGCGGSSATQETLAASSAENGEVIELTEEEAEVLELIESAPADDAAPVTRENYKDMLKELEEEVDQ